MNFLERAWYRKSAWLYLLWPVSWLFNVLAKRRRVQLESSSKRVILSVPVVVIGNISAGGTGKTPVVMALVAELKEKGLKPGVISRGYGGKPDSAPLAVTGDTRVGQSGDEAKLIAQQCQVPVVVDPDRVSAYKYLLTEYDVDIVVSDDGMQHYNLPRTVEVAVVDGQRLFGNHLVFPAGPLREPLTRLEDVDFVLLNEAAGLGEQQQQEATQLIDRYKKCQTLELEPTVFVNQLSEEKKPFAGAPFNMGSRLQAVTGLGNPDRFFGLLETLAYPVERYPFPDHHQYSKEDFDKLNLDEFHPVVMTEKDAIKCMDFAKNNYWTLKVKLKLPEQFVDEVLALIESRKTG